MDVFKTIVRNFVQVHLCKNYSNQGPKSHPPALQSFDDISASIH